MPFFGTSELAAPVRGVSLNYLREILREHGLLIGLVIVYWLAALGVSNFYNLSNTAS